MTVRDDPQTPEEAMRLALLYVFQAKTMTPLTAWAVISALRKDGFVVERESRFIDWEKLWRSIAFTGISRADVGLAQEEYERRR